MAKSSVMALSSSLSSVCRQCRIQQKLQSRALPRWLQPKLHQQSFSTSKASSTEVQIRAAPEIDLNESKALPARMLPKSPSYFTASPVFNDHLLLLQSLVKKHVSLPTASADQTPRPVWLKLSQYRDTTGEKVAASKYGKVLLLLTRLNKIHPRICPKEVKQILDRFRRPGAQQLQQAKPGRIDEYGRSTGVGRRKESTAKVYLVEGTGEVLVNGRSLVQMFPRMHDRETALWALKTTQRMDKYNVFALASGGGVTGQAEALTLALAKALLVHEPALKPALRRGKRSLFQRYAVAIANFEYSWLCYLGSQTC